MQFGNPATFAIDCVHEPIPNDKGWVFGRMCVWAGGLRLGNFEEPACMLDVTARHLEHVLQRLVELDEPEFVDLTDVELYELLDRAIYLDDDRGPGDVAADAAKYSKFDFLTNGGESFDRFKSFLALSNGQVLLLFSELSAEPVAVRVDRHSFVAEITSFLSWLECEAKNAG